MVYLNGFEEWLTDRLENRQPNSIEEVFDMYGSSDSCPYVDGRLFPISTDKKLKLVLTNRLGEIKIVDMEVSSKFHKAIRGIPCFSEQGFRCRVEVEGFLSDNKTLACSAILLSDDMGDIVYNLRFKNDSVARWIIDNKN